MAIITCPICQGKGCDTCHGLGQIDLQVSPPKKSSGGVSASIGKLLEEPHDYLWALKTRKN